MEYYDNKLHYRYGSMDPVGDDDVHTEDDSQNLVVHCCYLMIVVDNRTEECPLD